MGLIKEYNNELYELTLLDNNLADLIPYPTLKLMTDTLSENCINVYVYLLSLYYGNGCNPVQFTLEQVKKNIGICATTRSNDDIITNILLVLKKLGLIEYHLTAKK